MSAFLSIAGPDTEDLVNDGWTDLSKSINKAIRGIPRDQISPAKVMEAFEDADNEKMSEIRARCNEVEQINYACGRVTPMLFVHSSQPKLLDC